MEKFYLADEKTLNIHKKEVVRKDLLFFHLTRPAMRGTLGPDFEYNDRATLDHVKQYPDAFRKFMEEHPGHELEWSDMKPGEVRMVLKPKAPEVK